MSRETEKNQNFRSSLSLRETQVISFYRSNHWCSNCFAIHKRPLVIMCNCVTTLLLKCHQTSLFHETTLRFGNSKLFSQITTVLYVGRHTCWTPTNTPNMKAVLWAEFNEQFFDNLLNRHFDYH